MIVLFGTHYGWDEVEPIFINLAQALYGDVKDYIPERPGLEDPLTRVKWDGWITADGRSKKDARKMFMDAALPIMERNGFSSENPDKARI